MTATVITWKELCEQAQSVTEKMTDPETPLIERLEFFSDWMQSLGAVLGIYKREGKDHFEIPVEHKDLFYACSKALKAAARDLDSRNQGTHGVTS